MPFVYKIQHKETGKLYIGKTDNPAKRWQQHSRLHCKGCPYIHAALRKHGADAFQFDVLEECSSKEVNALEVAYINNLNARAPDGYNIAAGGDGGPHHADTKAKIAAANRKRKLSVASRALIALARKGSRASEETKVQMRAAHLGEKSPLYGKPLPGCKKVVQLSKKGELVKIHSGMTEAVRHLKNDHLLTYQQTRNYAAQIRLAIHGKIKSSYGFQWKYADTYVAECEPWHKPTFLEPEQSTKAPAEEYTFHGRKCNEPLSKS